MLNDDRDVRAVEMRYYVGAYGARGRDGLEPNVAHDPAVVPPIGKAPRDDVVAGAPHGIVDAYDDVVVRAGHQRARGIERERRIAALVVAEVVTVQPHVRDVTHRTELEQRICLPPLRWSEEIDSIEAAGRAAVGRRIEAPGHRDRVPGRAVIEDARAIGELRGESLHGRASVGEAEPGVEDGRLEAPRPIELLAQSRLAVKGWHGLAGLERDRAARLVLERQGGRQVGVRARRD